MSAFDTMPVKDITVYFHDPSGAVIATHKTDFPPSGSKGSKFALVSDGLPFEPRTSQFDAGDEVTGKTYLIPPSDFTTAVQGAVWSEFDQGDAPWALIGTIKRTAGTASMDVDLANPLPRIMAMTSSGEVLSSYADLKSIPPNQRRALRRELIVGRDLRCLEVAFVAFTRNSRSSPRTSRTRSMTARSSGDCASSGRHIAMSRMSMSRSLTGFQIA